MQEETRISNEIRDYLNSKKIFNRRNQAISSSYGLPDREFLYKGVCVGIEVKVPGESPKKHQKRKLDLYNKGGGLGLAVTSVEEVEKIVDFIDNYVEFRQPIALLYDKIINKKGEREK